MTTLSKSLQHTIHRAIASANGRGHELATVEHLLHSLVAEPDIQKILHACNVDIKRLNDDLVHYLDEDLSVLKSDVGSESKPTNGFQRVVQRALIHVRSSGNEEVTSANVLAALFYERGSTAVALLEEQQVTRLDIVNYLSHGSANADDEFHADPLAMDEVESEEVKQQAHKKVLDRYCSNLTERARLTELDPVIGRQEELERAMQVLCRRRKHNPIFVGESGVGKTALAEGLAQRIADGDVPQTLIGAEIYQLDMAQLIAGTRYRGDFEERVKEVVGALKGNPRSVVFIDEIHTVVGSGSTSAGAMDMANLLKPALQSGEFRCMGATTHAEYRKYFEKDRALARRFQKIEVDEPTVEHTVKILNGIKHRLEEHHDVKYSNVALRDAANLASRYIRDRFLPDKAIDVLDETGAYFRLRASKGSKGKIESERRRIVNSRDIERTVSAIAKVPTHTLTRNEGAKIGSLAADLRRLVFGQDAAIDAVTDAIKLSRAGLREPVKPVGSYMFVGPTGVGKTEVARQLALHLQVPLLRYDMSEYMEPHSVARLIGAPPGYVGHDHGGLLTEAIHKSPHSVVLLDELEKAHPDIINVLLQVMDYGTLTDSSGRVVKFNDAIIVMTSNVGAVSLARRPIGFTSARHASDTHTAIERTFSPEFRNRLDAIVTFAPLTLSDIERVVDKMLMELEGLLGQRNVEIQISAKARSWLAATGFDPQLGARPLGRKISEYIKKPLSDEMLFGKIKNGGTVEISEELDDNGEITSLKLVCLPREARPSKSLRHKKTSRSTSVSLS